LSDLAPYGVGGDSLFLLEEAVRESKAQPHQKKAVRGKLLSISEAKEKYRMKKDTFYQLIKTRELEPVLVPFSPMLLDSADIEDLILKYKG